MAAVFEIIGTADLSEQISVYFHLERNVYIGRKFYTREIMNNHMKQFEVMINKTELYW